jgi:hypothetical protein
MKGAIAQCAEELVREKFGDSKWNEVCTTAGLPADTRFMPATDIDDGATLRVVAAIGKECNLTSSQVADAFGSYWVCVYAPRQYAAYFRGVNSSRDLLAKMDTVHDMVTRSMPGARPPRFSYSWTDDKTLVMDYQSPRGLVELFIGLIKGVGEKYNERLAVSAAGSKVTIRFPTAA